MYDYRSTEGDGPSNEHAERRRQGQGQRDVTCQHDMRSGRQSADRWRQRVEQGLRQRLPGSVHSK